MDILTVFNGSTLTANHFIEWQADYHHASRSHSLSCHLGPPSLPQRRVFYRAYSGIDNGLSSNEVDLPPYEAEDQRIIRLEAEVAIWEGASHASWALWAIVQGRDAILERVEKWLKDAEEGETAVTTPTEQRNSDALSGLHRTKSGELRDADGRLQLDADDQVGQEADFDYLSYASVGRDLLLLRVVKDPRLMLFSSGAHEDVQRFLSAPWRFVRISTQLRLINLKLAFMPYGTLPRMIPS